MVNSNEFTGLYTIGALSHLARATGKGGDAEDDDLSRLGAWGLKLFQSDHDYGIIDEFDRAAGMEELMLTTMAQEVPGIFEEVVQITQANTPSPATTRPEVHRRDVGNGMHGVIITESKSMYVTNAKSHESRAHQRALDVFEEKGHAAKIHYSIYNKLCSNVKIVRTHLDTGILKGLIAEYMAKFDTSKDGQRPDEYNRDGYQVILLGACAISLGCKIPPDFLTFLTHHYQHVGLKGGALQQMAKALREYNAGETYNFDSLDLCQTMLQGGAPHPDRYFSDSEIINVEWPGGVPTDMLRSIVGKVQAQQATNGAEGDRVGDSGNRCAGCGSSDAKGGGELSALHQMLEGEVLRREVSEAGLEGAQEALQGELGLRAGCPGKA